MNNEKIQEEPELPVRKLSLSLSGDVKLIQDKLCIWLRCVFSSVTSLENVSRITADTLEDVTLSCGQNTFALFRRGDLPRVHSEKK